MTTRALASAPRASRRASAVTSNAPARRRWVTDVLARARPPWEGEVQLSYALGKLSTPLPLMMPASVIEAAGTGPIKQAIGSGPFRFVASEWVTGSRAVYERFDGYVPRDEPPSGTAGGKRVYVDRVVWTTIPDAATAMAAGVQ